jgi:hypothetical protein
MGERGIPQTRHQQGQMQPAGQVQGGSARHGRDSNTGPDALQGLFPLQSVACSLFLRSFLMNRP